MAAIVYHGLQSCLESQIVESRTLRLSLPLSKTLTPQPIDLPFMTTFWDSNSKTHYSEEISNKTDTLHDNYSSSNSNPNMGGWSFLQALSNVCQGPKEPLEKESIYVHPQGKRSSLLLSPKSLELCTEDLGNETGTDIIENGIDFLSSSDCDGGNSPTREQTKPRPRLLLRAKKAKPQNFPPPLTTIRGSESLRVRPHREDGRLVIEAVKVPSSTSYFQAERSHGRLRLSLLENCTPSFDPGEDAKEDNEGFESEMNDQRQEVEEEDEEKEGTEEETEDEEEDVENGERDACECEEIKGDSWKIGGEGRMEKYERPRSRCKEGEHENNELLNWEPLWVTTS